jgi:hypothetical protein
MIQNCDPPNDLDSPWSLANRHVVQSEMLNRDSNPFCTHCQERRRLIPMPGVAWGWEAQHEDHCPEHEDNQDGMEVHLVDLGKAMVAREAESIWEASSEAADEVAGDEDDEGRGSE